MDFGIKKKVALVAAASEGLGKACALSLAREGAMLVICSRREKEIWETAREIESLTGSQVHPIAADLTSAADVDNLVKVTKESYGTVEILVNNCGGPPTGDVLSLSDDDWYKGVELTLLSTVRLTRGVLPLMISQAWGRIITIVSVAAKQPINELLLSSTLRPGILGFSKVLANLYAKHNITVNTVCPGYVLTKRQQELMEARSEKQKIRPDDYAAEVGAQVPIGRLGRPEEIGNVVTFLASQQASYINGVNLLVDGGMTKGIN